jgi:hypothetical protein
MKALEELRELSAQRKGPPCQFGTVNLKGEEASALAAGLADQSITSKAISTFLAKRGTAIKPWTVSRHRRGDCGCAK